MRVAGKEEDTPRRSVMSGDIWPQPDPVGNLSIDQRKKLNFQPPFPISYGVWAALSDERGQNSEDRGVKSKHTESGDGT